MGKNKVTVVKNENKRDKFKRVVEPRVRKAIKSISLIGNCASGSYGYVSDDIAHITTALRASIVSLEKRFESKGQHQIDFDLE